MKLKTRRILYIIFIILFILLSTVVVLYTAGYRYHFKKEKFQKSGGIILEFKPKEVEIYIQDKKIETTGFFDNSFKMADLLPGQYDVEIKKEGYHTWNKKINVESEKINFIKDIILFKKNVLPKIKLQGNIENISVSPMDDRIFFTERKEDNLYFKILNERSNKISNIALFKTTTTEEIIPKFSLNEKRLIFKVNEKNYIYNFSTEELINIEKLSPKITDINPVKPDSVDAGQFNRVKNIRWSQNSDDVLYFLNNNEIYQLNLLNSETKKLTQNNSASKIIDFCINGGKIYLINSKANNFSLEQWNKNGDEKLLLLENISSDFRFLPCPKPYLTLLDTKNNKVMVINTDTKEIIIEDSAKNIKWSKKLDNDNYKLVYNNDFEIHTYDINGGEKKLIIRHSKAIDSISWIKDYNHIAFIYGNLINITDLDENNKIINTLFKGGKIEGIITSYNGKKLYFKGKIGEQIGLFEIDIL